MAAAAAVAAAAVASAAGGQPADAATTAAPEAVTPAKEGPVEALKELQRSDAVGREQWGAYCDERGEGKRDPSKHPAEFVSTFLEQYKAGHRIEIPQSPLADLIKQGQRKSTPWKHAWANYCQAYGGGVNDPAKHEEKFLIGFLDFLGQSGSMAMRGGGGYGGPPGRRRNGGAGGYGGGGYVYVDAKKEALVNRIKAFQRTGEEQKAAWAAYCDEALGGVRDPLRHESGILLSFCVKHSVP